MSYYQDNKDVVLKKPYDRFHNRGCKQKSTKYYRKNADLLRYEDNMKYKNMPKKEKKKKRKYQREMYHNPKYNEHLK